MKQKYRSLKLYLLGLTAGAFIFGWSIIARSDAAQLASATTATTNTANDSTLSQAASGTTFQTSNSTQQFSFQPRIRTRTS